MKDFWKKDFEMFLGELDSIFEFLFQPFTVTTGNPLQLRPSFEEATEKSETSSFWKNEFETFAKEVDTIAKFLTQPIEIK